MTYDEAVKHLKFMAMNLTGELATETNKYEQRYLGETLESVDASIEALEKQIPMGDDDTMECPRCHMVEFGYLRPKYCDNCGQRIADWSEVD